jgi:hypothetical protein
MFKLSEMYDRTINLYAKTKLGFNRPSLASSFISIKKYSPIFSVATDKSSVDEGSAIKFDINCFNVKDGTTVYYSITGCSASDFTDENLIGSCVITGGAGSFTKTLASDVTTEGIEHFKVGLKTSVNGRVIVYANTVSIADTSLTPAPVYTVSATPDSTNESGTVVFNWSVTNSVGAALTWEITGVSVGDFTDGLGLSGSLSGVSGTVTKVLSQDQLTEELETITFSFKAAGIVVARCNSTVTNSSFTPLCRSVGTPVTFFSTVSSASKYYSITRLTDTKALVVFATTASSPYYSRAGVLDVSDSTVTCGSLIDFAEGQAVQTMEIGRAHV